MTISIAEHLNEIARQLDVYNVPNDGRTVTITQTQYDSLKEEVSTIPSVCGQFCGGPLTEYPNMKPMFDRFTINIEG